MHFRYHAETYWNQENASLVNLIMIEKKHSSENFLGKIYQMITKTSQIFTKKTGNYREGNHPSKRQQFLKFWASQCSDSQNKNEEQYSNWHSAEKPCQKTPRRQKISC